MLNELNKDVLNRWYEATDEEKAEIEKEEYAKLIELADSAKNILGNKALNDYFNTVMTESFTAFLSLPLNSELKDYRAVHFDAVAVKRLKLRLMSLIAKADQKTREMGNKSAVGEHFNG